MSITHKPDAGAARLEDIAARVGVSRSEVSRVINGRVREGKGVGAAMRQRILDAAQEMNYRPHRAAQALARGRTDTVALMMVITKHEQEGSGPAVHDELSPHYHEIIGALTYTLQRYGINLLLAQCGEADPLGAMEQIARSRSCDGMVITDLRVADPRIALLQDAGLPFVVRGSSDAAGVVAVGADNFQIGYRAVAHLHELGHRHILCFNIRQDLMSGRGRYAGMCAACDELGLHAEYRDDTRTRQGADDAMRERLALPDFPTAVFTVDEIAAQAAMGALEEAGLSVPADVSVITCLNARFMHQIAPHLTVLDFASGTGWAAEAGHLLAAMLRGDTVEPGQRLIAPELNCALQHRPASRVIRVFDDGLLYVTVLT